MDKKKLPLIIFGVIIAIFIIVSALKTADSYRVETTTAAVTVSESDVRSQAKTTTAAVTVSESDVSFDVNSVPSFAGKPYVLIDNNNPDFGITDITTTSYETYGELDSLGRCTECMACVGQDLMPTQPRDSISAVKPTGWQSVRYSFVDGGSLYNRCHLIAFMLTGENANRRNLITGTRYLNTEGMLPFETQVCDYVKMSGNHVLYRVTPVFKGKELVARGVHMEGYSVEDKGKGVCFNVYCYNVQPGVKIDYKTGKSTDAKETATKKGATQGTYYININNKKFHKPDCDAVPKISDKNKKKFTGNREDLIESGYTPCGACQP